MPDGGVDRRRDIAKRFRGRHAKPLNSDLLYIHLEFLLEGGWKNKRTPSRRPRSSAWLSFEENLSHHAAVFVIEKGGSGRRTFLDDRW
jgi:hypothetical protein